MHLSIIFEVENNDFRMDDETLNAERVSEKVRQISAQIRGGAEYGQIRDTNGYHVGSWGFKEKVQIIQNQQPEGYVQGKPYYREDHCYE